MKKQILFIVSTLLIAQFELIAQPGQKWSIGGNNVNKGDFIGTSNSEPFILKANNVEGLRVDAAGNTGISNDLAIGGGLSFAGSNRKGFYYTPANFMGGKNPEVFSYAMQGPITATAQLDPCQIGFNNGNPLHQFNGTIQCMGNNVTTGDLYVLTSGYDGANGFIDLSGGGLVSGGSALLINYYCGKDIFMCTGNRGGYIGMGENVSIGMPVRDMSTTLNILSHGFKALSIKDHTSSEIFYVGDDGKVGIGTNNTPGAYRLYVKDGILTERLKVALSTNANEWGDYVFEDTYRRMSFKEQECYYKKNHHLKGVPSAKELKDNGMDVSSLFTSVVVNLEEARLDVIQVHNENKDLKKENDQLQADLALLKKEIKKMQSEIDQLKK